MPGCKVRRRFPGIRPAPTTSETGFSSVTHPPMVRKPCWTTAEMWSLAYRETGRCGAAVPGPKGWVPREDSAGLFEGRSTLSTGQAGETRGSFLLFSVPRWFSSRSGVWSGGSGTEVFTLPRRWSGEGSGGARGGCALRGLTARSGSAGCGPVPLCSLSNSDLINGKNGHGNEES